MTRSPLRTLTTLFVFVALVAAACSSDSATNTAEQANPVDETEPVEDVEPASGEASTFTAEVWADNWFALSVNGELVGEDSVPITTERSFNAEVFTFEATYPLTIAIEAKDFKETDSGIEYIGAGNQQMGDGGIIAQFTDTTTGQVVAATSSDWAALVVHRAPLNTGCEKDPDPDTTCEFEITETPPDWTGVDYDDTGWEAATEWTEAAVSPKDGYDEIAWDASATLIWGSDLEVDNTVLLRHTVTVDGGATESAIDTNAGVLIGCETTIADDVPTFYATYFRCADTSMDGDTVVIVSVNEPPHLSAYYPEDHAQYEPFDTTGDRRQNPNQISGETITVRIPTDPVESGTTIDTQTVNAATGDATDYPFGPAGVALDGVAYYNSLAGPGDNIEDEVFTFDSLSGHPQQQGGYHYHGTSVGPLRVLADVGVVTTAVVGVAEVELYGVMCDGTVLLGSIELDGSPVAGDLDLQGGHIHDIVDADGTAMLSNRYHIHMASDLSLDPRGLTPEAQYYSTCDVG